MATRAGDPGPAQAKSPALSFVTPCLDTLLAFVSIQMMQIWATPALCHCSNSPFPLAFATVFVKQLMEW
jgi:hypothetical protein